MNKEQMYKSATPVKLSKDKMPVKKKMKKLYFISVLLIVAAATNAQQIPYSQQMAQTAMRTWPIPQ